MTAFKKYTLSCTYTRGNTRKWGNSMLEKSTKMPVTCPLKYNTNELGVSLIETIVGLALISIVAVAFLSGMATNYRGKMVQDEKSFGEAIASSQIEYVKKQSFSTDEYSYDVSTLSRGYIQQPSWWDSSNPPLLESEYDGYYSVVKAEDFDVDGDSTIEVPGDDDSIRQITIEVYNTQNELVINLIGYKTDK